MDPKRLIQNNYLAVMAFLVLALAWLEQPPSVARAEAIPASTAPSWAEADEWVFPLEEPVRLAQGFQKPNSDFSSGHRGIDLAAELSQPILAPASGTLSFVGTVVDREVITIRRSDGKLISFEPACSNTLAGDKVIRAQVIGWVCEPDATYRQHCESERCLHFSVRLAGEYISPLSFIAKQRPSRLLVLRP